MIFLSMTSTRGVRCTPDALTVGVRRTPVKCDRGSSRGRCCMAREKQMERRPRLSKGVVLGSAVALADRAGSEGLTMRTLAAELGVVPMALYKHVANKEDLVDGMV